MDNIEYFFREHMHLIDEELIAAVTEASTIRQLEKNELLMRQGVKPEGFCFVVSGLLRGYYIGYDGSEITDCFGFQYGAAAMPFGDVAQPSPIYIEALEKSEILIIPAALVQELIKSKVEVVHIYNQLLINGAAEHWEIKMALYQYSATQRYQWFCERYEGLIDRIPHKYVASFLGMTPVSLSRLRRNLKTDTENI